MKAMTNQIFNGNKIVIEPARPRFNTDSEKFTNPRLYVGHLSPYTTKSDLLRIFSQFGRIVDFVQQQDFAFIEYDNLTSAKIAISKMNEKTLNNSKICVEISKKANRAREKDKRHSQRSRSRSLPKKRGRDKVI